MRVVVAGTMRLRVLALAAALLVAQPQVAMGGAVVFVSDRGYFSAGDQVMIESQIESEATSLPRETYETLGRGAIEGIVLGLLGTGSGSAPETAPEWFDARAVTHEPPRVVLLGWGGEISPADLADASFAADVSRLGAEIVAPNTGVLGSREVDTTAIAETVLVSHRGRAFVAGDCGAEFGADTTKLDTNDAVAQWRRMVPLWGNETWAGHAPDLVIVCGGDTTGNTTDGTKIQNYGLTLFADFAAALRADSQSWAGVFVGVQGDEDVKNESVAECVREMLSDEARLTRTRSMHASQISRSLLQDDASSTHACDALCRLQTNVVTGLVFFWTIVLTVLFGYALMHNLDSPTRFEKSKDEDQR